MKVYIVRSYEHISGIYESKEDAEEDCKKLNPVRYSTNPYEVEEWEVEPSRKRK